MKIHTRPMRHAFAALAIALGFTTLPAQGQVAASKHNPVKGAIDFHVHTAPDISARNLTDLDLARIGERYEMRAIVLKNHVTMTADRAAQINPMVPGIEVYGGIVLNKAVGGINADAVRAMAKMSGARGKVVWFPTFDSAHHRKNFGNKPGGLQVLENGKLTNEAEAVLAAIKDHDLILETGHLSPEEVLALVARAREMGIGKIVVTHAMSQVPGLSIEQMKTLAGHGAYLELVYLDHLRTPHAHLEWLKEWRPLSIAQMAEAVKAIGADHFIIASDLGQTGNPVHPDGMVGMVEGMLAQGVAQADVDKMVRGNPAGLLGL